MSHRPTERQTGQGRSLSQNVPGRPSVLVVDDEPAVRRLLGTLLEAHGYRAILAADAIGARRAVESEGVVLILCDVHLPGESGLQLAQDLLCRSPYAIALMMSGDGAGLSGEPPVAGICGYIAKPFDVNDVVERVGRVLCGWSIGAEPELGGAALLWP